MNSAGKSLFYFGIYVLLIGLVICAIPDAFIKLLGLPSIPLGWARVIGILALIIGAYDVLISRHNIRPLISASVYFRIFFFLGTTSLFVTGQMPKEIMPLGLIDLLGATWTALALRSETKVNHEVISDQFG